MKVYNLRTLIGIAAATEEAARMKLQSIYEAAGVFSWNAVETVSDDELARKELDLLEELELEGEVEDD